MKTNGLAVGVMMIVASGCGGRPPDDALAAEVIPAATVDAAPAIEVEEDPRQARWRSAKARLDAGQKAFDAGDLPKAMLDAQRGIELLGDDYAGPNVADDSALKLDLARERAEQQPKDGALVMLRMLGDRLELARRHWQIGP